MLRSSVLILFLPRLFLEEVLRDIPIFFSFFPACSFGIELEFYGRLLRFFTRDLFEFFLVLLISRREGKQRKQKIYKAKYGTKKDLMQHAKVLHKVLNS